MDHVFTWPKKTIYTMKNLLCILLIAFTIISCNKKDEEMDMEELDDHSTTKASIRLMFDNAFDEETISFVKPFITDSADTIQITDFKYIISDVVFTDDEGHAFEEPNSYHLVIASGTEERWSTLIENVPTGSYTYVSFRLGIAQNVFSDLSLLLDNHTQVEVNEMIKNDMSGYYNLKMEGSYNSNGGENGSLNINNQESTQSVIYTFGEIAHHDMSSMRLAHAGAPGAIDIHVVEDSVTQVHFQANLNMLFGLPLILDFDQLSHVSELNTLVHRNYSNGLFMLHHSQFE